MVIDLSSHIRQPLRRNLYKLAAPIVERGLAITDFNDLYDRTREAYLKHPDYPSAHAWFNSGLREVGARYEADLPEGFQVPADGPLIIVSNHPFGLLDPIVLGDFMTKLRPDMKVMTNFLMGGMEEIRPWIIPVDPFHAEDSAQHNLGAMKETLRHLKAGKALAIFPSGEVAHFRMGQGVEESPWSDHVGALIRRTEASVLPVYFEGQNSILFQSIGMVHPRLRTGLILRELFQKKKAVVQMRVGQVIPFSRLRKFATDESLTQYLRVHTFVLGQRGKEGLKPKPVAKLDPAPVSVSDLSESHAAEIQVLRDKGAKLAAQGHLEVFVATATEIPLGLQEIGRLREVTFREVGEGTGKAVDLDRYDEHYLHVFLWDEKERRIAGAYRIGRCDLILRRQGPKGLYTSSLFKFQKPFLSHLDDALEMGRSFISLPYQRSVSALPLLWKGVLTWVSRHPHYRKLFGPVSISQDYAGLSRKLMVEFLKDNKLHPELATLVSPRHPFRYEKNKRLLREFISADLSQVEDFSALISSLEEDGKGLPTLLKHYLRLNGTLLNFNLDKDFGSCLDGLILVDVTKTDPKLLAKYMGEETCAAYLKHQAQLHKQ
jgi:putative hemolysin